MSHVDIEYSRDGVANLLKLYKYMLIVDVEHTCTEDGSISPQEREIIEIGAVFVCAQSFDIVSEFSQMVRPVRHPILSEFCTNLTGISQAQIADAENFKRVYKEFEAWSSLTPEYCFSSWGSYDLTQINIDCRFHNIPELKPQTIVNLKKAFSKLHGIKPWVGLTKALEITGNEFQGTHHRALDDARNTVKLLPLIFGNQS